VHTDPPIYLVDDFLSLEARPSRGGPRCQRGRARATKAPQRPCRCCRAAAAPRAAPRRAARVRAADARRGAPQECDALIAASDGRLQDAHVVGRGDGLTNSFGYRQARAARRDCMRGRAARLRARARPAPSGCRRRTRLRADRRGRPAARQGKTPGRTSRTCTLAKNEVEFLIAKARARRARRRPAARPMHRVSIPSHRFRPAGRAPRRR
jgi:hypothetical protein